MLNPSIVITATENGFIVTDNTDYSSQQIISTYKLYDYGLGGTPTANTEFNTTLITIGGVEIFNDFVSFHTDSSGGIHDAEEAYNHIVDTVNENNVFVKARLNKAGSTNYKLWQVEFYNFDNNTVGQVLAVTSTIDPPELTNMVGDNQITFRNLFIVNPKGKYEDVGGVAQVEAIKFNYKQYTIGEVITLDFCGETINYTIVNEDTDCIIPELVKLINEGTDANNWFTLEAKMVGDDTLEITQTNIGNPFSVSISYSDVALVTPFTQEVITANVPSMETPSLTSINDYEFTETDRGGKYIVNLSIGNTCDFNTGTENYYSWVWDKKQLDCCFNSKLLKETCCAKTEEKILESTALRNVIYGVEIAERDNANPEDIQKLINFGWDYCDDCGCVNCK